MLKSLALLLVSVQPLSARSTAVLLDGAGVGLPPSLQLAVVPKPTKSTMAALGSGQAPVSAVVVFTRATLPAVALKAVVPVASGVGRAGCAVLAPVASLMR